SRPTSMATTSWRLMGGSASGGGPGFGWPACSAALARSSCSFFRSSLNFVRASSRICETCASVNWGDPTYALTAGSDRHPASATRASAPAASTARSRRRAVTRAASGRSAAKPTVKRPESGPSTVDPPGRVIGGTSRWLLGRHCLTVLGGGCARGPGRTRRLPATEHVPQQARAPVQQGLVAQRLAAHPPCRGAGHRGRPADRRVLPPLLQ